MYYECCVCKSVRQDAILHHFPATEKRLQKWLKCLKSDDLNKLSPEELSKVFICQKHFEKRFISSKSRLIVAAYPSLFTEDEISSGKPSQPNMDTENVNPAMEHNYSRKRHFDHTYCMREPLRDVNASTSAECPTLSEDPVPSSSSENVNPAMEHNYSRKRHFDHTYCMREPLRDVNASTSTECPTLSEDPVPSSCSAIPVTTELIGASSARETCQLPNTDIPLGSREQLVADENPANYNPSQGQVAGLRETKSAKRRRRRRLIKKVTNMTPECETIYTEYIKAKQQANYYRRAKRAMKFSKEETFQKLTRHMKPFAKKFLKMQINLCTKDKKGRRFTREEKIIALSIMKQSPKSYKFLRKIFILPSRSTLNKMVAKLKIESGICPQVFELIAKEIESWDEKKKMCSVIFDEMSLEAGLTYDKNKDKINGFVELSEKKNSFADHALVFMLRGAVYKWQQPVAFYFCEGATKGVDLKNILKDVITAVTGCGLNPIALICDQGSAFQSTLNSLKKDTERAKILGNEVPDGTITMSGVNLQIIFDPPHLVKGLRNNFLNKDIIMEGQISKWNDIVDVYKTDCNHTEARLLHKLNDQHVIPEKIKKMKVKNCVKVFSQTVSAALLYTSNFPYYADGKPVSKTLKNTAKTILFFDQLFDSVNGAATSSKKTKKGKLLRTAVTVKSPHHVFWRESVQKLKKIKYVTSNGQQKSVPSLNNFIITLTSLMKLWQLLNKKNITIMRPRYFNSDPIEIFFGQVRAYNYRSNDPNCHSFICTYKSLLVTRVIKFHNETFNCEDDSADQIFNLSLLFDENENVQPDHPKTVSYGTIVEQARRERLNVHSRAYTTGWVVKKILEKNRCHRCKENFTSDQSGIHQWISQREYATARKSLNYPSEAAVRCFGTVIKETNNFLDHNAHTHEICKTVKQIILSKNSFEFVDCPEHHTELLHNFITLTVRLTINNWCSIINKILKGTDIVRLNNQNLPLMQKKALEKYQKRIKNKKFNK